MQQHHAGNAKLNPHKVRELLKLRAEGWSYPKLARAFGVSENTVAKICKGTAWRSVTGGQEVLTDEEAQLRQLTSPPISQEEIAASQERFLRLLAAEQGQGAAAESTVPACYQRANNPSELSALVEAAVQRRAESGPPPEPVKVRYPVPPRVADDLSQHEVREAAAVNAAQLLETLKDEHSDSLRPTDGDVVQPHSDR